MKLRSKLNLPREHGAWAMLYIPFLLGILVAGRGGWPVVLLLIAATALFISRESLLVWWRARRRGRDSQSAGGTLLIYLFIAAVCALPLVLIWRLYGLIPLGLAGVALLVINGKHATALEDRTIGNEILAIIGLTSTAPAAYYAARGAWDRTAFYLWLLSIFYFASSVFYIKLRIYSINPRKQDQQRRVWQSCAFYHSFLLIALLALRLSGSLSLFVLIAFLPVLGRTFWSMFKPAGQVNLKRAGILELIYSVIFLVCIAAGFRAS
jgi:hypothetical protein